MAERKDYERQTSPVMCPECGERMIAKSTSVHVTFYKCENDKCNSKSLVPMPRKTRAEREAYANMTSGLRLNQELDGPLKDGHELEGPLNQGPAKKAPRKKVEK